MQHSVSLCDQLHLATAGNLQQRLVNWLGNKHCFHGDQWLPWGSKLVSKTHSPGFEFRSHNTDFASDQKKTGV